MEMTEHEQVLLDIAAYLTALNTLMDDMETVSLCQPKNDMAALVYEAWDWVETAQKRLKPLVQHLYDREPE